jgi:hypothetical protein
LAEKFLLAIASALTLSIGQPCLHAAKAASIADSPAKSPADRAAQPNNKDAANKSHDRPNAADEMYASLRLTEQQNTALKVEYLPPLTGNAGNQILLSIGGVKLRGKALSQVYDMLKGQLGDTIDVEVVGDNRIVQKRKILFAKDYKSDPEGFSANSLRSDLVSLGELSTFRSNILEGTGAPYDLMARHRCLVALNDGKYISAEPAPLTNQMLLDSLILSQSMGDLSTADQILALLLKNTQSQKILHQDCAKNLQLAVKNLVATDQADSALALCQVASASAEASEAFRAEKIHTLRALSEIKTIAGQAAADAYANKLAADLEARPIDYYANLVWLCNYFIERGQKERAIKLYNHAAKEIQSRRLNSSIATPSYLGLTSEQALANLLYNKAWLCADTGDLVQAQADLKALSDFYNLCFTDKERAILNEVPIYFPTPDQVLQARSALGQGVKLAKPPATETEPTYSHYKDLDDSAQAGLQKLAAIHKALATNNRSLAEAGASSLLTLYAQQMPQPHERYYDLTRLNMFCASLGVARAFSDKGWYQSSDELLNKLQSIVSQKTLSLNWREVACAMVRAELVVNASRTQREVEGKFDALEERYHSTAIRDADNSEPNESVRREDSWRIKLRLLAMAYYHAGDVKRAKIFIDRALMPNLPSRLKAGDRALLADDNEPEERFALLMDAACISAKLGDYPSASKLAALAKVENIKLDDRSTASILEYAKVCQAAGKVGEAIAWLRLNRTPVMAMPFATLRESIIEHNRSPQRDDNGAKIDEMLASLIAAKGDYPQAYKIINESAAKSNFNTPHSACLLAGDLAARLGDYAAAAAYFEGASWHSPALPTGADTTTKFKQKAVDMAEKAGNYNTKALVKLYCDLAQGQSGQSIERAYKLYKKAVDITPDGDPDKARLVSLMSTYAGYLSPKKEKQTPPTNEEKAALIKTNEANLRKVAELAEQNAQPDAYWFWMGVAASAAQAGQIEQAVTDAKHGIGLYGRKSNPLSFGRGELMTASGLAYILTKAGAAEQVESLYREAVNRVKVVKGENSVAAQWQLAQFFEYYVQNNKQDKALAILDEILSTDLTQGPYQLPNHTRSHCGFGPVQINTSEQVADQIRAVAQSSIKDTDNTFALTVLSKLLAAQNKQLKADDRRIGITLSAIAKSYYRVKAYDKALSNYEKALTILFKYEPEQYVYSQFYQEYPAVLKALGKQSVLDEIEKRKADKAKKEIEEKDEELLLAQELLKRLESEKIGINAYVIKERSLTLKLQQELSAYLDKYNRLAKSSSNKLELLNAAKTLEEFGDRHNIMLLQTKFMAARIEIEDILNQTDESQKHENYCSLIERFIQLKQIPEASIWLAKLATLPAIGIDDYKYLEWLDYRIRCGDQNYPTPRSLKIEQTIMGGSLDDQSGYETDMLRHLQALYKAVEKAGSTNQLELYAAKIEKKTALQDKANAEAVALALKARQEYLSHTPLERANKELEKAKQDFTNNNAAEFFKARATIFIQSCQLPETDRLQFMSSCLEVARDLIKAHKSDAALVFLAATQAPIRAIDVQKATNIIEETIAVALQLRDRQTSSWIGALSCVARAAQCPRGESEALLAREKAYQVIMAKGAVNDVTLASEAQVRELAKGYRINRSIFAWQLLRINDKNVYSSDGKSAEKIARATIEGAGEDRQPLLLEDDTQAYQPVAANSTTSSAVTMAPFKPAMTAPASAKPLDRRELVCLPPGEYGTNKLVFGNIAFLTPGRTRIFISGDSLVDGPVVRQTQGGLVNTQSIREPKGEKNTLEIWYNGEGTIRLDDRFNFSGLIYAPFARVELCGPTSGKFTGAIVARDVIVSGNVTINYDPAYEYLNGQ